MALPSFNRLSLVSQAAAGGINGAVGREHDGVAGEGGRGWYIVALGLMER